MATENLKIAATEEFVIARTFDAPRELVWKCWTEPKHMQQWWGPKGTKGEVVKMDFRPGGIYHYYLVTPDGGKMWGKITYREIVPPEKIIFINSFSDEHEGITRHPMSPTWPAEMLSTILFVETAGKTTVTIKWIPVNATPAEIKTFDDGRAGMTQGWSGSLDQLTEYLKTLK